MSITYRKATPGDIEYLLWLRQETMVEHLTNSGIEMNKEEHLERINYQFDQSKIILLNNGPIGFLKTKEEEGKIEIIQVQVEPRHQRKGYGQEIVNAVIEEATKNNVDVVLSVLKKNHALALYQRLGFAITGEDEHSYFMEHKKQTIS